MTLGLRAGLGVLVSTCWMLGPWAAPAVAGDALEVPGDYDTIQEAIEEAEDGDTVLVAAGDYLENIDFLGKDITVVSEDGPEDTVIDGSDETLGEDYGSTVRFADGETGDARLEGFTITGGTGTDFAGGPTGSVRSGGGIVCVGASPTIVDCVIADNDLQGVLGADSSMTLDKCVITGHTYAGVSCTGEYAVTIRDCVIEKNADAIFSAGVYLTRNSSELSCDDFEPSRIEGCNFLENDGGILGGAVTVSVPVDIIDCVFDDNSGTFGGAVTVACESLVADCIITNNSASWGAGIRGTWAVDMRVERCLIVGNRSANGAAYAGAGSVPPLSPTITFSHCTLADNVDTGGDDGGGAVWMPDLTEATVEFENCILWGNGEEPFVEGSGAVEATYSCIEGDLISGVGNIDDDPLFADTLVGDYTLDAKSPCIDAGDPDAPLDPDDTTADMGAYFHDQTDVLLLRGDADNSGVVSAIPDALYLLQWGFQEGPEPECAAAADADGNGSLNALTDPLYLLRWNFQGGDEPPDPGPDECGPDPDGAECEVPPPGCK